MNRLGQISIALSFLATNFGVVVCASASEQLDQPKRSSNVLVIHSYNPELSWTRESKEGVDQGFQQSEYKTTVFHEFLDAKRYPELHHQNSFLEGIRQKYKHTTLDLLMVADDPGLNLVLEAHEEYFSELPVVFMGINNVQEKFLDKPWLTGVFETHSVAETIVEAKRQTNVDDIIIITDSSETGKANQRGLQELRSTVGMPSNFHVLEDITLDEILEKIGPYTDSWPIYLGGQLRQGSRNGPLVGFIQGTEKLNSDIPNPIYIDTSVILNHGAVGGKVLDGNYHAKQAVQLAESLLSGSSPEHIEPILEAKNQWVFDADELEEANISLVDLPPGSILINERLSVYEQHPELVWSAISLLSLSFITILVLSNAIHRQKSAESKLRANEKQLEQTVDNRTAELRDALKSLQQSKAETEERSLELAQKNDELELSKRSADKANQAKSDFLAQMSHELRTPLNSILGFTQLLQRDATLPTQHQNHIEIISSSGSHLLNLINNILDLSKVEACKSKLNKKDFHVEALLKSVCQMLALEARKKDILLCCHCEPGFPAYIYQDESKYKQILINVIGNAVKFTAQGQVSLKAEALESNQLRFTISDTGPGISPEDMESLFKPFSQAQEGKFHGQSTGLGLSISAEFVKLMGGSIEVDSEIGKGSIFTITIPYETSKAVASHYYASGFKTSLKLNPQQVPPKILVVDDDPSTRKLFTELLNESGFVVKAAVNGQEAIAICHEWPPNAILMDMKMPVMDGIEATRQIKQTLKPSPIVILVTTNTCDSFSRNG